MSSFKFTWMSDTHVGYRQYGLERRERDFQLAFLNAVQTAIDVGSAFIIHSGDIIHNNRPTADTIMCLKKAHDMLQKAGIPMWVVSGNHDWSEPHWINAINPDNDEDGIFLIDGKTLEYVDTANQKFTIYGCPWLPRDPFLASIPEIPDADVIVWHGAIKEFIGFPQASALSLEELPLSKCQLWAAGDIHVNRMRTIENKVRGGVTHVGYPGSTEMNSASEEEVKVIKVVTVEDSKITKMIDLPIASRKVLKLTIGCEEDVQGHIDALKKLANGERYSPLVYIDYPSDIGFDIKTRFNTALNANEFVLRFEQEAVSRDESGDYTSVAQQHLTPEDILYKMLPPDSVILPLARQLIDPAQDANRHLDEFIDAACQ